MLEQLDEQWNPVAVQTSWKLEPLQCFLPTEEEMEDATTSTSHTGAGNHDGDGASCRDSSEP